MKRLIGHIAILFVVNITFSQYAIAQDKEADAVEEEGVLEEVVVLGLKERYGSGLSRAEFVLGAEDIQQRPMGAEITQSLIKIPGIQISTGDSRGGSFSMEVYLRGLNDQQIGMSVDGIPAGDSRYNGGSPPNRYVDSVNVGVIQVSQSSGEIGAPSNSALGGFINFGTLNPTDEFTTEFGVGLGNYDYQQFYFKVNTGEILGGIRSYWSFSDQSNDIWTGPKSRDKSRQHFDVKLLKDFESGSSISYRLSYNELDDNDFGIVSLGDFLNDPTSDTVNDEFAGDPDVDGGFTGYGGALGGDREDILTYFNMDFVLSDSIGLSINPYYHKLDGKSNAYQTDSTTTESGDPRDQNTIEEEYDENGTRVADMRVTPRDRKRYGLTSELNFDDVFGFNDIRVGLWLEEDKTNEDRNFYRVTDTRAGIEYSRNALGYIQYERTLDTSTFYYYIQDKMSFLDDRLLLDMGLTVHDVEYEWESPSEFSGTHKVSAESDPVDWKLGGLYRFTDNLEMYVGWSQNFGGIFEDAFLGSSSAIDPNSLEPETSENLDFGLRYVTETAAISVQYYKIDFENRLTTVPTEIDPEDIDDVINGNSPTQVVNQGGVNSSGIEVTGSLIRGEFTLYGTYTHQKAEWADDDPSQGIIKGARVHDIPEDSFYGEITWSPNDEFNVAISAKNVSDRLGGNIFVPGFCNRFFCFDENGEGVDGGEFLRHEEIDGYWLFGVVASYNLPPMGRLNRFRVQLNIDNVFDEEYIASVTGATTSLPEFGLIGGLTAESALDRYFIGSPRTVTLSLSAEF